MVVEEEGLEEVFGHFLVGSECLGRRIMRDSVL